MSKYFDWPSSLKRLVRFDAARAEDVNDALDELTAGLDGLDLDTDRAIKLPIGTADQTLALSGGQRANLLLSFDASGNITAVAGGGRYRGDWLTATAYVVSDYFRDPVSKNIYSAVAAHTSGVLATDISAGRVQLAINVADAEAAKAAAAASAATAATQAGVATTQADAARAIANFAGIWSALTGPLNKPATVYHAGFFYVLVNNLANVAASEPGVTADWIAAGRIPSYEYDSRADLRTTAGNLAIVDGLGLFRHVTGSDEPDDDESCFTTATGRWLLECPHWDVVADWQLPDTTVRDAVGSIVRERVACPISSVATVAQASFSALVPGAASGDAVLATPLAAVGTNIAITAMVTAADTVVVTLNNPSAAAATGIPTDWIVTVFQEI